MCNAYLKLEVAVDRDKILQKLVALQCTMRSRVRLGLLSNDVIDKSGLEGTILLDVMRDLGPSLSICALRLRAVVGEAAALLSVNDTAQLIALVARDTPLTTENAANWQNHVMTRTVTSMARVTQRPLWCLDVVVAVFGQATRSLSSQRVAEAFDSGDISITPDGGEAVFKVFFALLGRPFPASVLERVWCNRECAQLPLLSASTSLNRHTEFLITDIELINSLITTLLQLSSLGHTVSCSAILEHTMSMSPKETFIALCEDRQVSRLKKRLLTTLNSHRKVLLECNTRLMAEMWWSGHASLVLATLAHEVVSPLADGCITKPLVSNIPGAKFARDVIRAVGVSLASVFDLDARFGVCISVVDADLTNDSGALVALLKHALNDSINELKIIDACLNFAEIDVLSGQWKLETGCTVVQTVRNHVHAKHMRLKTGFVGLMPPERRSLEAIGVTANIHRKPRASHKSALKETNNLFGAVSCSITSCNASLATGRLFGGGAFGENAASIGGVHGFDAPSHADDYGHQIASGAANVGEMDIEVVPRLQMSKAMGAGDEHLIPGAITAENRPLDMRKLMPSASEMQSAVAPSEIVLDCVHMVFNNVSHSNLEAKVKDIAPLLHKEHFGWFANYLVVKRISTQPNFHSLYLAFLEKLSADDPQQRLLKYVIDAVFHNIAKLLRSSKITTSTSERSLLKNLGSWLGQITLARNRPILQRQLDVKELLYQGYESGRLIAICPFVAKILEGAKSSVVFKPPNPWLIGLMAVLRDLYDVEELKMNIKFEIEVLSKDLGIKLDAVISPVTLTTRAQPVKDRSPDFNVKRVVGEPMGDPSLSQGVSANSTQCSSLAPHQQNDQQQGQSGNFGLLRDNVHSFTPGHTGTHTGPAYSTSTQEQQSSFTEQTVIPNLASYVTVSTQVSSGPAGATLRRIAPVAIDRAIREIIQPVVERSVTIACITTKELVAKDFATEPDEGRVRKAAQLMVSNLAGSLALVTCKEPLRISIAKHLRALLQPQLGTTFTGNEQHEQHAVHTCAAENLDLGCMLIEKAATEKAIRDVDDALVPTLQGRSKRFESGSYPAVANAFANMGRYPAALPEALRPKATGLLAHQFFVYESFQRTTRQPHLQQQPPTTHHQQALIESRDSRISHAQQQQLKHKQRQPPSSHGVARSGGAATLSFVAQQAAAERASISIAELMDAYRSATVKLDSEFATLSTKMQGVTSEISFAQLRNHPIVSHVGELLLAAARVECTSRDDAALAIAQSTFKAMCEQRALEPPVRLETLAIVLAAVADISAHLVRDEVANWIAFLPAHSEADRYLHAHVLVRLLGVELLDVAELDAYLARNMEGGRSEPWLDITLSFVELSVAQYHLATFPGDLQRIARVLEIVARQSRPPPALRRLVAALSADQHSRLHHHHQRQQQQRNYGDTGSTSSTPPSGKMTGTTQQAQPIQAHRRSVSTTSAARELRLASKAPDDPIGAQEQVRVLLEHWIRVWNESPGSEKAYAQYLTLLQQHAVPKSEQSTERFVRLATVTCVESCVDSRTESTDKKESSATSLTYSIIDAYAKLLILLVKYAVPETSSNTTVAGVAQRLSLLNRVLSTLTRTLVADYDATAELGGFDQRPYFRLFLNLLQDLNVPDPVLDSSNSRVLAAFATALHALQPAVAPGFAFSWLELMSHRMFMPNLLLAKKQKGWVLMHRLLVDLFVFLEPYLRKVQLSDAVRLLYKGTLRVLLVLLHDFPEFLSDYHFSFCDVIPSSCIQLRNLFLSAFPRSMRLPDPFTPNLKVDLLPEISQPPNILSNCVVALHACGLRESLDEYLQTRHPISFLLDLPRKLRSQTTNSDNSKSLTYNVPLINSLVVHVGTTAIAQLHAKSGNNSQHPITHSTPMDVFQHLMNNLDSEGRYFLLNAIANQLRYPNNHTHYFSCVLLYLFAEATSEFIQEQVTRVLLERLIVHRPHPWGLLITFIELIKNPRYSFWSHGFTHCATEIERVFESVARLQLRLLLSLHALQFNNRPQVPVWALAT